MNTPDQMVEPSAIWRMLRRGRTPEQVAGILHMPITLVLKAHREQTEALRTIDPNLIADSPARQPGR